MAFSCSSDFPEQISKCRKSIRDSFKSSHEALLVRENILLSQVDEIEKEYNNEIQEKNGLVKSLHRELTQCEENLSANKLTDVNKIVRSAIVNKLQELTVEKDFRIEFFWDNSIETTFAQLGSIELNSEIIILPSSTFPPHVKPVVPDYKAKQLPTAYCCKKSSEHNAAGELNRPRGIAVQYNTGNIYVADMGNHRIQVFSSKGDYLFQFSENMNQPLCICISQSKVLVTDIRDHCINVFELDGKIINTFGSQGSGEGQFDHPLGLDVSDRKNNIYVCDNRNHRVQILTEELKYHSMLGIGLLKYPHYVKVTRDRVLVLDETNPCIFVFTSNHDLINRLITRGDGEQCNSPMCFDIDRKYNIIMSDTNSHCVYVFNSEGEQIHKIGNKGQDIGEFYHPYGLALSNTGQVVVVCQKKTNSLQFF